MGDFSSTFDVINKTSHNLYFDKDVDISAEYGYILRSSDVLPSKNSSSSFQVKDRAVGGTEATLTFRKTRGGDVAFKIYVTCPVDGNNQVRMVEEHGVLVSFTTYWPRGHPMILSVVINDA